MKRESAADKIYASQQELSAGKHKYDLMTFKVTPEGKVFLNDTRITGVTSFKTRLVSPYDAELTLKLIIKRAPVQDVAELKV